LSFCFSSRTILSLTFFRRAVLARGASKKISPFVCKVDEGEVLTCIREDGPGFILSRDKAEVF